MGSERFGLVTSIVSDYGSIFASSIYSGNNSISSMERVL